jgi:diaminohydroxyphosphoribosylaminopyrimidine deaminase/5-amino-6-(5-phosphoribosylamino)uracil reductase
MQHALRLAEQGLGEVWPNPAVGCVIVKNNQVIGLGRTQKGGRPHAETQALAMAGADARGATVYVTLEPCAHHGHTSPCAEALIAAEVAEVVIACGDPDPRVNGAGVKMLRSSGIRVTESVCEQEARMLNCGFFSRITRGRPWVTLKIASSADGFIADSTHQTTSITSALARQHSHLLRRRNDAILTGIGTVLADDPSLTCRLAGLEARTPQRIVLDRQHRLPPTARMLHDGKGEVWVLNSEFCTLNSVLTHLADRGITRLMVEAGNQLNTSFIKANLIDEIYWYRAPPLLHEGLPAFDHPLEIEYKKTDSLTLGQDTLSIYRLSPYIANT